MRLSSREGTLEGAEEGPFHCVLVIGLAQSVCELRTQRLTEKGK